MGIYSCHQAILRNVLFECGGFNPDIVKQKLIGNGETGLNIKVLDAGYNFAYTDAAVTHHIIPRTRMTQKYMNYRFENSKKVLMKMIMFSHIPSLFKFYLNSLAEKFTNKDVWRLNRAYFHYFFHRIKCDLKLVTDDDWRKYVVKYDYTDE